MYSHGRGKNLLNSRIDFCMKSYTWHQQ